MSLTEPNINRRQKDSSLSYKFQRLRERIRGAIDSGELGGKLPGERALAKTFQVNAKTLSKALTDLAAEGVLDRSIGRGTYVKGQAPTAHTTGRLLVLADPQTPTGLIAELRKTHPTLQVMTDPTEGVRPSFINQFNSVVDLASNTPEAFLRDLVVRNIPVIAVGREPKTYSTHAVVVDRLLGVSRLTRDLLLAGHRRFAVVAHQGEIAFVDAVRQTAARFGGEAAIDAVYPNELTSAIDAGATAVICDSTPTSRQVADLLQSAGLNVPDRVSLTAVDISEGGTVCNGYYVTPEQLAGAINDLLTNTQNSRPTVLWLAGEFFDHQTAGVSKAPAALLDEAGITPFTQLDGESLTTSN